MSNDNKKLIEDILGEAADIGDIDLSGVDVDEILKETENLAANTQIQDKSLEFLTSKDDPMKNLFIDLNLNTTSNSDNLIQNMIEGLNKEIIPKKEDTSKKLPKFQNSIDFINYMETKYEKISKNENDDQIFLLKNYKLNSKKKIEVLKFPPKTTLSSRFFKDGNIITSITAYDDVIFAGNNLGKIRVYSCEKEFEYPRVPGTVNEK